MPALFSLSAIRPAGHGHGQVRPLSVRNFMLVALAIVLAAGVTMLVITQASASEIAGSDISAKLTQDAIGAAALGSLLVSSVVAVLLVMRRPSAGRRHSGRDTPAV